MDDMITISLERYEELVKSEIKLALAQEIITNTQPYELEKFLVPLIGPKETTK